MGKRADQTQNISLQSFIFGNWEDLKKLRNYFAPPYGFFVIAETMQRRYIVTSMLVERDLLKRVENLKLQIAIFVLKTNKQTNKSKAETKKDKRTLIRRNEIMDYFISSADAHAQMDSILFKARRE